VVAGYSVGELAAFAAAGVFDADIAFELSRLRARLMAASTADEPTGMVAVRELPLQVIQTWCGRHGLFIAIRLGVDRAIVAGPAAALRTPAIERESYDDIGRAPRALLDARERRAPSPARPAEAVETVEAVAVSDLEVIAAAAGDVTETASADLTIF